MQLVKVVLLGRDEEWGPAGVVAPVQVGTGSDEEAQAHKRIVVLRVVGLGLGFRDDVRRRAPLVGCNTYLARLRYGSDNHV